MQRETLRFRKSSFSGGHSECVEVAQTLQHVRDSKNPSGPVLTADLRALLTALRKHR